jgi:O-antigen/teichoic acid export membrane protein
MTNQASGMLIEAMPAAVGAVAEVQRPSMPGQTLEYGLGYVLFAAARLLRDLAVARILGPATFGVWGALLIYRQYSNYTDFGFTNGLGRVLPKLLADEKMTEARQAMSAGWVVAMAGTMVFALAIAFRLLLRFHSYSEVTLWGIVTVAALMFIDKHYMYSLVVFRSAHRVGESGLWMGLLGILEFVLGAVLTRRFGLYGLYVSAFLAAATAVTCMYFRQPLRWIFRPTKTSFRMLLTPSLTLMGMGLGQIAIHNVDRVVILWCRGTGADLGQYQVAASISLVVSQLPNILATVMVPEMYRFGKESSAQLRRYLQLPMVMISMMGSAVATTGAIVLPELIRRLLPKYQTAASLTSVLMWGEVCFAIAMVPDAVMVALDRGYQSLLVRCLAIAGGMTASWWVLNHGYGLHTVAGCMCAAQASGGLIIGVMAARAAKLSIRPITVAFLPVLYALAVLAGLSLAFPAPGGVAQMVMKLVLCGLALSPFAVIPLRFFGVRVPGVERVIGYLHWGEEA